MTTTVALQTKKITRADLSEAFGGNVRLVRVFEQLLQDITTNIPDAIVQVSDISAAPFVLAAPSTLTPNGLVLTGGSGISIAQSGTALDVSLSVPVPVAFGGTGATTATAARGNLGAAASGANGDITSLTGLTTPLPISEGGTGQTTAAAALTALGGVTAAGAAAAAPVQTVFGRSGNVIAATGDYSVAQVIGAAATSGTLAQFASTSSAQLASVLSDETGTGSAVFSTGPTLTAPVVNGVTNGSAAAAGVVGEVLTASPAALALTSGTSTNVASISLSAGDWLVWGQLVFSAGGTTTLSSWASGFNQTSAALPGFPLTTQQSGITLAAGAIACQQPVPRRISVAAATTYYLVGSATFSGSTCYGQGIIYANRIR